MAKTLSNSITGIALCVGFALVSGNAFAQTNEPPPTGAIIDLAGGETGMAAQVINHGAPIEESVNFSAGVANTAITFAFREDPAFISFGDVSLIDTTTGSSNLILNGDFATGSLSPWTYANVYGASAGGVVDGCGAFASGYCWYDGAVQAYDAISQSVATTVGDSYTLSFYYTDNSGDTLFSDVSTNGNTIGTGGNGIDILGYAQAGLPSAGGSVTPEPESLVLMGTGLVGALRMAWRRRSAK